MLRKQLEKIIQDIIPDSNIDSNAWKSVLNQCVTAPSIFHLLNTTHIYAAEYSAINLSLVMYNNKQAVGIMPLITHQNKNKEWVLSSNGNAIVEPIFIPTLARKVKKRLELQLAEMICTLFSALGVVRCHFVNMEYDQLTSWYMMWIDKAQEVFVTHHLLVDLSLSLDEIRLKFRKSFKPLVNKGLKKWKVEVHEQVSDEIFEQFRLLHKEVSGKSTRNIESWNEQKKQINSSESFLVTVSNESENMVGAGLFSYSSYQGFYCVGAYKRELFNQPIGHPVQLKAIETLKKKGVFWYEIGQKHLEIDRTTPSEKELSISNFKEGFSTRIIARQHLIVNI